MTEPDKAQLWAILAADHPVLAPAYRAGAAASEARIKALEEALADTLSGLNYIRELQGTLYGVGWDRFQSYRSMLKEPRND